MEVSVKSWKWVSNHGSECQIMEVSVKSWKWVSNHGSECEIMEASVKSWKWVSNYGRARQITIITGGSYQNCVDCVTFIREWCLTPFVVLGLPNK